MAAPDFSRGNPFKPGSAIMPAHVAGRKAERQIIDEAIAAITKERKEGALEDAPMTHISIIGPRGVGKTTLLVLAKKKAVEQDVLVIDTVQLPDLKELVQELVDAPKRGWRRFVPRWLSRIKDFGAQAGGTGLNIGLKDEPGPGSSLKKALLTRLQEQPVLLLMDEVMHYDLGSLTSVLQVSQFMIREQLPLAVILAGTPDLVYHLNATNASFIDRRKNIRINLFNDDESADALSTPLTNCGIEVEAEALKMMVALSDNYPFFIQMIGQKVWTLLAKKQQATVDVALVKAASKEMQGDRDDFYYHRYAEIEKLKLSPYAHQIIEAVESAKDKRVARENLEAELLGRNEGLSEERVDFIVDKMQQKGFLWVYEKGLLGPGIPSFFTYVKETMRVVAEAKPLMSAHYHDLTHYPAKKVGGKGLEVSIELPLGEEYGTIIKKEDLCLAGPEGDLYRVNLIEDTRKSPTLELASFTGYILYLGAKEGDSFDDYGKKLFPPEQFWRNQPSTR